MTTETSPSVSKVNKAFMKLKKYLDGSDPDFKKSVARVLSEAATSGIKIEFVPKTGRLSIKNELVERVEHLESSVESFRNQNAVEVSEEKQIEVKPVVNYERKEVVPVLWEATIDGNKVTGVRKFPDWTGTVKIEKIGNLATVNWTLKISDVHPGRSPSLSKESVWFVSVPGHRFSDSTGVVSSSKSGVLISKAAGEGFILLKQTMTPLNVYDVCSGDVSGPVVLIGSFVTVIS